MGNEVRARCLVLGDCFPSWLLHLTSLGYNLDRVLLKHPRFLEQILFGVWRRCRSVEQLRLGSGMRVMAPSWKGCNLFPGWPGNREHLKFAHGIRSGKCLFNEHPKEIFCRLESRIGSGYSLESRGDYDKNDCGISTLPQFIVLGGSRRDTDFSGKRCIHSPFAGYVGTSFSTKAQSGCG